jgi:hypothetical protein
MAWRLFRPGRRHAEAFQVDHPAHPRRPHAGVNAGHVAAHAVAEQVDRRRGRIMVEHRVEVGDVVREPVGVGARARGQAEAAPVGRDDVPVAGQVVGDELERGADIHPAVQHENDRRPFPAPVAYVRAQAAHGDEFGTGSFHCAPDKRTTVRIIRGC